MTKREAEIKTTEQVIAEAHQLLGGSLQQRFAVLADKASPKEARRHAAAYTASHFVPLMVAMDDGALSSEQCRILTRGLWDAATAAPINSKTEGLNAVMWEHALSGLFQYDEKAAVDTVRRIVRDPALKTRSTPAKMLARNLNFFGMIWRPQHWGNSPANATSNFNRTATQLKSRLQPRSLEALRLDECKADLASWRQRERAAALALPGPVRE